MSIVYYPAVFHEASDVGGYWVEFPDLPGCFSQGKTIEETIEFSKEALGLYLDTNEDIYERTFSNPSSIQDTMKLLFLLNMILYIMQESIKQRR